VPKDVIARVGDEEIKISDYLAQIGEIGQQLPGSYGMELADSIHDLAWQNLVTYSIYNQLMAKEGLRITTAEIKEIIKSNPPPEIASLPEMRNEQGEFDFTKYHQLLKDPRNVDWVYRYELQIRREYPRRKINVALATAGWLTPVEIEILTRLFSTRFSGIIIQFPVANYLSLVDTARERIVDYYHRTLRDWQTPPRRQCQYVFFPRVPSRRDSEDLNRRKEELEEDLKAGIDFLTLAQQYSNDPKIALKIGELPEDVRKRVVRSRIGAVVRTEDGEFRFFKRIGRDSVLRIVLKVITSYETVMDLKDRIESFLSLAKEIGFDEACREYNLEPKLTYPFEEEKVAFPLLKDPRQLSEFAFKAKEGDLSPPLLARGGYLIFRLVSIFPAQTIPLRKAYQWVKGRYIKEEAVKLASNDAHLFYQKLRSGKKLEELWKGFPRAERMRVNNQPLYTLKRTYGPKVVGAILALRPDEPSQPITTEYAVFIPIPKEMSEEKGEVINYTTRLRQLRTEFLVQKMINSFEIKDYRSFEIE